MTARDVIAQALALSEAATDGPWVTGWDEQQFYVAPAADRRNDWARIAEWTYAINPGNSVDQDECDTRDAEFIAAARTLLPALAKALGDVLGQHFQMDDGSRNGSCGSCDWEYPCPTVGTITAALSEVTP